jgi:hypothetical protein
LIVPRPPNIVWGHPYEGSAMAKPKETEAPTKGAGTGAGGEVARVIGILGANVVLVIVAIVFSSGEQGVLPDLNRTTFAVGLLPLSAAVGLLLACRRLDLSLPMILVLAATLRSRPLEFLPTDAYSLAAALCAVGAVVALASALVTWVGRISSALWTGLVATGLWGLSQWLGGPIAAGPWAWPAALAAALGVLVVGAAALGATGLVVLPSLPPIVRTGSKGLLGLVSAWVVAGAALGLACQSELVGPLPDQPLASYAGVLAAGALGGAFILRGRWGAVIAVGLTCLGHLAWFYAWNTQTGSPVAHVAIAAGAPLVVIPLYLVMDWSVRRETSESSPTGLLA